MEKHIPSINLKECDNTKIIDINTNQYNNTVNTNSGFSVVEYF